jgi:hydrocephalus-inducing protein
MNDFSVTPSEGFVAPQDDVVLTVTFNPRRNQDAHFTADVRCILENHEPVQMTLTGQCIGDPSKSDQPLSFSAQVRQKSTQSFAIKNDTAEAWRLQPLIKKDAEGSEYFSVPSEVAVPAGGQASVDVTYQPLTLTAQDEQEVGKRRPEKHRGVVFVGTPDGNAMVYNLEGVAQPPAVETKQVTEVPCKTPHMQGVKIANWLQNRQRLTVALQLLSPDPNSEEAKSIKINGVDTFDLLPPGLERDYKFSVFAYRAGEATVQVHLESPDTGEWYDVQVPLKFTEAQSLAEINLNTACRQLARHPITLANPLSSVVSFTCQTNNPEMQFDPEKFEVPAGGEATLELLYRPVQVGSGESSITLVDQSGQLGSYPYTVKYNVSQPGLERSVVFKSPLGGSVTETFKFLHFVQKPGSYTARIEPAPGHKGATSDFTVETKDIKSGPAASSVEGAEINVDIRFQPSVLSEVRALLVLSSPDCADYKALLMGYTQPPQPQGPVRLQSGKAENVPFLNPFDMAVDFNFQVDNPSFQVGQRSMRMNPKQQANVAVTFKPDNGKEQQGCLIITSPQANAPWKFFLKGCV